MVAASHLFDTDSIPQEAISSLGTAILTLAIIDFFFKTLLQGTLRNIWRRTPEYQRMKQIQENQERLQQRQEELIAAMNKGKEVIQETGVIIQEEKKFQYKTMLEQINQQVQYISEDIESLRDELTSEFKDIRWRIMEEREGKDSIREIEAEAGLDE